MREIKFRAWDKDANCMHPPMTITEIGLIMRQQESPSINAVAFKYAFESLVWMQFTGLKDKNGKDIYEGDIIDDGLYKNIVIIWRPDLASFALSRKGWAFDHYFGEAVDPSKVEIIGDIYRNHELLK